MIKLMSLFFMSAVFMYAAFFSWHMISEDWSWARLPTVILLTLLTIFHICLFAVNAFGVKNEKG